MPELYKYQNDMRKDDNIQSLLFDKKYHSLQEIPNTVMMLGYNCFYIDETKNKYRVRQFNPGLFRESPRYKIINSKAVPGLQYVVEY